MVDQRIVSLGFVVSLLLLLLDCVSGQSKAGFSERLTLLRLRSSLGLRGNDWPIKGDPCGDWNGIQCDDNGNVVGINISGFRRTRIGKQNPQFAVDPLRNLTRLSSFNASGFALPGSIPDWFGFSLSTLRVLDLSSSSVRGSLPVSLGGLTSLRTLNLSRNALTGSVPNSLGDLLNLSELDLSRNSLTGALPSSFSSLQNLSSLDVSSNYLTGPIPPGVGLLSKLLYLNFSSNSFSSPIPSQLGDLVNLVDLDLSINSLSGSVPRELRKLRNLQNMVIGDNLFTGTLPDDLFGSASQLQSLVLRENGFSGKLPDAYWSLPKLQILDIAKNNFTGMLPNSSSDPSRTAAKVDISLNSFYGELTPVLRRFREINLSGNYFEGKVPDYVVGTNVSVTSNCLQNEKGQKLAEDCSAFYRSMGLVFNDFGRPNSTQPTSRKASSGISRRTVIILASVAGGVGFILIFIVLPILVVLCIRRRGRSAQRRNDDRPKPVEEASQPPKGPQTFDLSHLGDPFTYEQLLQATEEFNDANLMKRGHSGTLFRAFLENGVPVVIKKIDTKESKNESYISELELFSKAGPGNQRLVPFLGHCLGNESQKFLVYKYMRHGDLASSLFRKSDNEADGLKSLDWITRLKIALGAAEGLSYLHHECSPPLVHRDVQASSILLDDKFEVRLGSLSEVYAQGDAYQSRISRLLRLPQGEPSTSGATNATCPYDVYCFGKVLLELVTGKLGISAPDNAQAKAYMEEALQYISTSEKELVTKIIDPSLLVDEDLLEEVWAMAIIAKSCLNPKPTRRPLMRHIVNALENPLKVVREDNNSGSGSSRLRTNSSRGSWNAAIFGSWRQSASDVHAGGAATNNSGGLRSSGSQESSGRNNNNNGNSSSRRRQSSEIVPEPAAYGEDV